MAQPFNFGYGLEADDAQDCKDGDDHNRYRQYMFLVFNYIFALLENFI